MKIHHEIGERTGRGAPALAIGVFDGVHIGHRALLDTLRPYTAAGAQLAVLSFRNHPLRHLRPEQTPPAVLTLEERVDRLAAAGVAETYLVPFDERLAGTPAREFLEDVLIRRLCVRAVAVGVSFRFGAGRSGDIALAAEVFAAHGVAFHAVPHVLEGGERVSSTRVRSLLAAGDLAAVDRLLGEPYRLVGRVALGAGRGHDLGFPTANLELAPDLGLPPDGVYTTAVRYDGTAFDGLVSIGSNPTFDGAKRTVEVWIKDFDRTIYGHTVTIESLRFLRGQQKFASVDELQRQMRRDAAALEATKPS